MSSLVNSTPEKQPKVFLLSHTPENLFLKDEELEKGGERKKGRREMKEDIVQHPPWPGRALRERERVRERREPPKDDRIHHQTQTHTH